MSVGRDDDYGDQYDLATFVRRVLSVVDPPLRRRQIERHLTTVDPETVSGHLQEVLSRSSRGDVAATEMLIPLVAFMNTATDPEVMCLEAIDLEARRQEHYGVVWMMLEPPPERVIDQRSVLKMSGNSQSLGFRKSQARKPDQRALERLTLDDHPAVLEILCANPRFSEALVMTMVTRRPTTPELISVVARNARWFQRPTVREAIANNPYGSTGLALRILPTLNYRMWLAMRFANHLHPAVRGYASYLVNLRAGEGEKGPTPDSIQSTLH